MATWPIKFILKFLSLVLIGYCFLSILAFMYLAYGLGQASKNISDVQAWSKPGNSVARFIIKPLTLIPDIAVLHNGSQLIDNVSVEILSIRENYQVSSFEEIDTSQFLPMLEMLSSSLPEIQQDFQNSLLIKRYSSGSIQEYIDSTNAIVQAVAPIGSDSILSNR